MDTAAKARGWITAVDAETGAARWKYAAPRPVLGGITPTAGGLVFAGDLSGAFYAFDAESGYDTNTTPAIQQQIERGLLELVPEGVKIEHRWAGTMGFARDGRPLVGWLDAAHHLAICAGFTGHGMGMATACTEDLAELLAFKRAPAIASLDPQRFAEVREARDALVALGGVAG